MQKHGIPYPFVGFVTCISRSRERNCPSYVLLGRKIICPYSYTHEDIREFVCNNSLEARIGKQNVHGNKVYSGMERQKNVYPSLQIVLPTSQQTPLSKFVIWFMTC